MLWIFLACAPHLVTTGLIRVEPASVELDTMRGQHWQLVLQPDSEALRRLQDCTVEVTGSRLGSRVYVHDWRVLDSKMGGGAFVGTVREWGAQIAIDDRNTRSTVALEPTSGEALRPYLGQVVMVVGPVVGNRQVEVVAFRVLTGDAAGSPPAPTGAPP
jgi:hypothetical protein